MRTLRVPAILIKRQIADDGPYLVAALLISVALILSTAAWAFFDNPNVGMNRHLPVPTICLLVALVVLVCVGSYLFGVGQVQADRASGISAMLSVLPARRSQIFLVRIMTGSLFLLVVLVFLVSVVTEAVLFDLLPGRGWIQVRHTEWSPAFLVDVLTCALAGVFLTALVCYCFGLRRARTASTFPTALDGLPLILVLILLVVIKGFTLLSVLLLVLLILGLSVSLLARPGPSAIPIIATGLIEGILVSVPLFCGRYLCDFALANHAVDISQSVEIRPSGLFPQAREGNKPSVAFGNIREKDFFTRSSDRFVGLPNLLTTLGIFDSIESRWLTQIAFHRPSGWYWQPARFDNALGQVVISSRGRTLYAGPEGVAFEPDVSLGRFVSPLLGDGILYDRGSARFYAINTEDQIVRRGEELIDHSWDPIYIFSDPYGSRMCIVRLEGVPAPYENYCREYVAVLDRSGRIGLLDRNTLGVLGWVGHLPRPRTLFGRGSGRRRDVLDCDADVIAGAPNAGYLGMVVGSLSRQGTSLTLAVFDKDGKEIRTTHSRRDSFESTLAIGKYFLEWLHPPVLTLASFFTAYSFEAGATHRALFFMPNSFVALQRDRETSFGLQLLAALLFLLPSGAFAGFLSWRVARDAALTGMSRGARRWWGLGTLALGLPAYITYRLTRPKVVLALCRNCGQGRRGGPGRMPSLRQRVGGGDPRRTGVVGHERAYPGPLVGCVSRTAPCWPWNGA